MERRGVALALALAAALAAGCSKGAAGGTSSSSGGATGATGSGGSGGASSGATGSTSGGGCGSACGTIWDSSGNTVDCGLCQYRAEAPPGSTSGGFPSLLQRGDGLYLGVEDSYALSVYREHDGGLDLLAQWTGLSVNTRNGPARFLAAQEDGGLVLAYEALSEVYLAHPLDDGGFESELVAQGQTPSVASDANGVLHVAYVDFASGSNEYVHAMRTASGWTHEVIEPDSLSSPGTPVVGIAPDGSLHVVYVTTMYGEGELHHAVLAGGAWTVEKVTDSWINYSDGQGTPSLAFDPSGEPRVLYSHNSSTWLASHSQSGWTTKQVDGVGYSFMALALDGSGGPHLAIGTVYGEPAGSSWALQALKVCEGGAQVDLALDADGSPIIASACNGMNLLRRLGRYPDSFSAQCQHISQTACTAACTCVADAGAGGDCCVAGSSLESCSQPFACPDNVEAHLCGDATTDPAVVSSCDGALGSLSCTSLNGGSDSGVQLPSECNAIYQ